MRALMILAGAWVVREFNWVLYLFGFFLVVTGMRMLVMAEKEPNLTKNPVLRFARQHLRIADGDHGEKFTVLKDGVRYFTPLFLVLILIDAVVSRAGGGLAGDRCGLDRVERGRQFDCHAQRIPSCAPDSTTHWRLQT